MNAGQFDDEELVSHLRALIADPKANLREDCPLCCAIMRKLRTEPSLSHLCQPFAGLQAELHGFAGTPCRDQAF